MKKLFIEKIEYCLSKEKEKMDIQSLFKQWESEEYGSLKLLKAKSENHAIYRYLCSSRAGIIHIHFHKENNVLHTTIKEHVLGYFLPFMLLLFGLLMMYIERVYASLFLILLSIFFLTFIYFYFKLFANKIKEKVLSILSIAQNSAKE